MISVYFVYVGLCNLNDGSIEEADDQPRSTVPLRRCKQKTPMHLRPKSHSPAWIYPLRNAHVFNGFRPVPKLKTMSLCVESGRDSFKILEYTKHRQRTRRYKKKSPFFSVRVL